MLYKYGLILTNTDLHVPTNNIEDKEEWPKLVRVINWLID